MTEQEWLAGGDVYAMFRHVRQQLPARKARLLMCGYLRGPEVWSLLVSKSSRRGVEVAEAFADGAAGPRELRLALQSANHAWNRTRPRDSAGRNAALMANDLCYQDRPLLAYGIWNFCRYQREGKLPSPACLVREVLGNPFRPAAVDPAWGTPAILPLAEAAYEERALPSGHLATDRLAVLADALEDAGCPDDRLLAHLRSGGPHVRGCWALDLVLNKG